MSALTNTCVLAVVVFIAGCVEASPEEAVSTQSGNTTSVWSLDLVRTLPGQQAEYLRNIEANWSNARRIAHEHRAVLSYRALVASPDSARGWDVVLMTEYVDSTAWANREAIFDSIFSSPEYVRQPTARPSSELREFAAGDVVLKGLVSGPSP